MGQLAQRVAMLAVAQDGGAVQRQRGPAEALPFHAGTPHAGLDSLDDQASFQFGNRPDDDHDGPA